MMEQAHNPDLNVAERYFLGELTSDEAEAYEAHYFECPSCAEYVREELALIRSLEEVASKPREAAAKVVPIDSRRRRAWFPAAAAAMLVIAIGVQLIRDDRAQPGIHVVQPKQIQTSLDRAAAAPALTFTEGSPISFDVEIASSDYSRFVVSLRDKANNVVAEEIELTAEQTAEPVSLVLSALPAGTYNVVIEGVREDGNRSPIISQPFEVRGGSR